MRTVDHTKNIIEVKDVSFAYDDEPVLKDVSLNVHKGDYLGIIGPNGGGKSTLVKVMLGLLKPQEGSVKLFNTNLGYVPQHAVNFDKKFPATVEEVVSMGLYGKKGLFNRLRAKDKKDVLESLENVGMLNYKDSLIGDLSGGQQQRVFIARALVSRPEILFLDEPTAGVDTKTQENFYELLDNLNNKYDLTLILISHDVEVISHHATEFATVNQTLVYSNSPEELIEQNYTSHHLHHHSH
jgi:zinc transport system ATP-binding protein